MYLCLFVCGFSVLSIVYTIKCQKCVKQGPQLDCLLWRKHSSILMTLLAICYWIPQRKKCVEYILFGPAHLIPVILNVALLNDDYLNTGVWENLEIYRSFATTVSQLKISDFSEDVFKVSKCCEFLWVKQWHNCSPAASFTNCVETL